MPYVLEKIGSEGRKRVDADVGPIWLASWISDVFGRRMASHYLKYTVLLIGRAGTT